MMKRHCASHKAVSFRVPPNLSDLGDALKRFQSSIILFQDLVVGFETRYDRIATEGLRHLATDMAERFHHIMATYHQINK